MKFHAKPLAVAVVVMSALSGFQALQPAAADTMKKEMSAVEMGQKLANNRQKGNCVACHAFKGAVLPGTVAPPLAGMKARYPDKAKLRAQIYDSTATNPHSAMPPFGKNKILTDKEIDEITDWVYTL